VVHIKNGYIFKEIRDHMGIHNFTIGKVPEGAV
jgi:hypothetical protein